MTSQYIGKVLVVDDDAKLRFVLRAGLSASGFEIEEACNGQMAVDRAIEWQPDVIVMDVGMPVMDGIEATHSLQADSRTKHIPILILTARSKTEDVVTGLEAGAQEYIRKPFDITELLARVRTLHRIVIAHKNLDELNMKLEQEVGVKTHRLQLLNDSMRSLNEADSDVKVLDLLLNGIKEITSANRISIMMAEPGSDYLLCKRAIGIDPDIVESIKVSSTDGITGQVFRSGKTLSASSIGDPATECREYGSNFFLSTPLVSSSNMGVDGVHGVINITERDDQRQFTPDEIECIRAIADAGALALDNIKQQDQLRQSVRMLLQTVGHLAEYRDEETTLHIERVSRMCRILAREMCKYPKPGYEASDEFVDMIEQAAPMHDIGKVGIPDEILTKPGKLTDEEFQIMKTHTNIGRRVLSLPLNPARPVPLLTTCVDIAYSHHERWDGRGYPQGLKEDNIPLAARIVTLVDAYDAITSRRRYKKERTHEEAVEIIQKDSGSHFDPNLVEIFLGCHEKFNAIRARYVDEVEETEKLEESIA